MKEQREESNGDEDTKDTPVTRTWTMKKIVSSHSLPFPWTGFAADRAGVGDLEPLCLIDSQWSSDEFTRLWLAGTLGQWSAEWT